MFQLGKVYYHLGYNRLAEHTLKIAVRVDPVSEDLWSLLGLVTEALAHEYVTQGNGGTYNHFLGNFREKTKKVPTRTVSWKLTEIS